MVSTLVWELTSVEKSFMRKKINLYSAYWYNGNINGGYQKGKILGNIGIGKRFL